uniref:Uncharacterized protein n=1 Tax=Lactuca sativa TaxID=4236 RepID=A0A9R1V555_LACSA|nr:hypothetical protein LSAT_V11C700374830 [Lactuca sativa]
MSHRPSEPDHRKIEDVEQLIEIINNVAREGAMLIFTLTDKNMLPQLDTPANDGVFYPPTSLARAQKQSHCAYALFPRKTPLSIYLAKKGFKVANVPIVMGVSLPKGLFEVNQEKVFVLTINNVVLKTIRRARSKTLGFAEEMRTNYSEMDHLRQDLDFA